MIILRRLVNKVKSMKDQKQANIIWINFIIMFIGLFVVSVMYHNLHVINKQVGFILSGLFILPSLLFLALIYLAGDQMYRKNLRIRIYCAIVFFFILSYWRLR